MATTITAAMLKHLVTQVYQQGQNADLSADQTVQLVAGAFSLGIDEPGMAERTNRYNLALEIRPAFMLAESFDFNETTWTQAVELAMYGTRKIKKRGRRPSGNPDVTVIEPEVIEPDTIEAGKDQHGNAYMIEYNENTANATWGKIFKQVIMEMEARGRALGEEADAEAGTYVVDSKGRRVEEANVETACKRLAIDLVAMIIKWATATEIDEEKMKKFAAEVFTGPFQETDQQLDSTRHQRDTTELEVTAQDEQEQVNLDETVAAIDRSMHGVEQNEQESDTHSRKNIFVDAMDELVGVVAKAKPSDAGGRAAQNRAKRALEKLKKRGAESITGKNSDAMDLIVARKMVKEAIKGGWLTEDEKAAVSEVAEAIADKLSQKTPSTANSAKTIQLSNNGKMLKVADAWEASDSESEDEDIFKAYTSNDGSRNAEPSNKLFIEYPNIELTPNAIKHGLIVYDPAKWEIQNMSFHNYYQQILMRYNAAIIKRTPNNLLNCLSYIFETDDLRYRYTKKFIQPGLSCEVENLPWEKFQAFIAHAVSVEFDTTHANTQEDFKIAFKDIEAQYGDEDTLSFINRVLRAMHEWQGPRWRDSKKNRQRVVEKLFKQVTNKQLRTDLRSPIFCAYRGRENNGKVDRLIKFMQQAHYDQLQEEKALKRRMKSM